MDNIILNIFRQDAFSALSLTSFVEKYPYLPQGLGQMNLFEPLPIRTTAMAVERRQGVIRVVPTSPRGAPLVERQTEKRDIRYFDVPRLAHGDTIQAAELQNVVPFERDGQTVDVLMQVQDEVTRRLAGPTGLQANMEATRELHRLGAVQGILLDTDGSTLFNWFNEFAITPATEIGFNLPAKVTGTLRPYCNQVVRQMMRAAQGAWLPTTTVQAIVGDTFWDEFVTHPDVEKTFLNWSDAQNLRKGTAFQAMPFGGIDWMNYRGSNDNATIAVPVDKAKFFPVNAPGVFQRGLAPGETFEWINQPGREEYVLPIIDRDRNMWWRQELYAYPLHICTRPEMLQSGRSEA